MTLRTASFRTKAGLVLGLALLGLGLAWLVWRGGEPSGHTQRQQGVALAAGRKAADLAKLPALPGDTAAQALDPIAADAARKLNADTPFADLHPVAAQPFLFAGTAQDRDRALDCLALAALAEAGSGDAGQRAVLQVVLNRVRHPAFAKTVCGVIFQGSQRPTGCQFTFTCDGSLARRYGDTAWAAARQRAEEALGGRVYAPVGTATHYHTDWVHPVWSGELDKIARVDTHLFFRWKGFWGSREAGRAPYRGSEPAVPQIAWLPAHAAAGILAAASEAAGAVPVSGPRAGERVGGGVIAARNPQGGIYLVALPASPSPAAALALGRRVCGGKGYCRVWGWAEASAVPAAFPVSREARARLSFSYAIETAGAEYVFYDCRRFEAVPRDRCLPRAN